MTAAHHEGYRFPDRYVLWHPASEEARLIVARILLEAGASARLPNRSGHTALERAINSGSLAMIALLRAAQS